MKKIMSIIMCASIVGTSIGALASEVPLSIVDESVVQEKIVSENEVVKLTQFLTETNTDLYFSTSDDLLLKLSKQNNDFFEKIMKIDNLNDRFFSNSTALEFEEMPHSKWDFRDDILYIDEHSMLNLHDYAKMIRDDVKEFNNSDYTDDVVLSVTECKIDEDTRILKVELNVLGPGYVPSIYRYVVIDKDEAKEITNPSESTYIGAIYAVDGDIWLSGGIVKFVHSFGSSRVWKLDDESNLLDAESIFENEFSQIDEEKSETIQDRILGVSNGKIVMTRHIRFYKEDGAAMRLDGIYEISKDGSIEKRSEMLQTEGDLNFILGKNNKIYFFDRFDRNNKLINLTDNNTLILPTIMK